MDPYRTLAEPPPAKGELASFSDDAIVAAVLAVVGAIRVVIALANGERFGAEATIATLMLVLGVIGLVRWCTERHVRR